MKGISAIIVVILLLLISVSLASILYIWFSSMMTDVTGGVTTSVESTTDYMNTRMSITNAKNTSLTEISVTIRNAGTNKIDLSKLDAFVDDNIVSVKPCEGIYGDVSEDNIVDAWDLTVISQYLAGTRTFNYCQKIKADVDEDGSITNTDVTYINNYIIGSDPYGRTGEAFSLPLGILDIDDSSTFTVTTSSMSTCEHVLKLSIAKGSEASRVISC